MFTGNNRKLNVARKLLSKYLFILYTDHLTYLFVSTVINIEEAVINKIDLCCKCACNLPGRQSKDV